MVVDQLGFRLSPMHASGNARPASTQPVDRFGEILRQWRLENVLQIIVGRAKAQEAGVHELSLEAGRSPVRPIGHVAGHGVANRDEVHAQLVGAASEQECFDERPVTESLED